MPTLTERIAAKVRVDDSGCWVWTAALDRDGYGRVWTGERRTFAHRASYEAHVGSIPDGLQLDHLCRNRACCNPEHLEPVTAQVNQHRSESVSGQNARKVECDHGHALDNLNTYITPGGRRNCRTCRRAATARYEQRRRERSYRATA